MLIIVDSSQWKHNFAGRIHVIGTPTRPGTLTNQRLAIPGSGTHARASIAACQIAQQACSEQRSHNSKQSCAIRGSHSIQTATTSFKASTSFKPATSFKQPHHSKHPHYPNQPHHSNSHIIQIQQSCMIQGSHSIQTTATSFKLKFVLRFQ